MSGCRMETGFFTLRPCRAATIGVCARCERDLCSRHITAAPDGTPLCLDCAARRRDESEAPWDDHGIHWIYRLRRHRRGRRSRGTTTWPEPFWTSDAYDRAWEADRPGDEGWDDGDHGVGTYFDS